MVLVIERERFNVDAVLVVQPALAGGYANNPVASAAHQAGGVRTHIAEALNHHPGLVRTHAELLCSLVTDDHQSAPRSFNAPVRPSQLQRLAGHTALTVWRTCMEYVSMIQAMICPSVLMSGPGTSFSGPSSSISSAV